MKTIVQFDLIKLGEKIAITHLQEYLEGKRYTVYYWELENEVHK